jgi:two-component sensor histidine kinase
LPFYGVRRHILIDLVFDRGRGMDKKYSFIRQDGDSLLAEVEKVPFRDGRDSFLWCKASPVYDIHGNIAGAIESIRDETDRKRAEEKIRRSLREKEALLAEIHHRVKNNMQIISSLLSLQSRDIKDEKALSLIKNCEDRIISMSLVHEKLYLSEDLSRIDFGNYITSITAMLFQSYRVDSRIVNFTTHIEDAFFGVETAIPLGLIVNELISNAMKHAFPNNRRGDLTVELARSDKADTYKLTVTDDGVGLPYGIDYKNTKTFGIQLIYMLTEQLNGEVGFESDSKTGTSFKITFREQKPRMEI